MGFWQGKKNKQLDEEMETILLELFRKLEEEKDPDKKKVILEEIQKVRIKYKDVRKSKAKWNIF